MLLLLVVFFPQKLVLDSGTSIAQIFCILGQNLLLLTLSPNRGKELVVHRMSGTALEPVTHRTGSQAVLCRFPGGSQAVPRRCLSGSFTNSCAVPPSAVEEPERIFR